MKSSILSISVFLLAGMATSAGAQIMEIVNSGDGLTNGGGVAVDSSGNVYVSGFGSDNVFRITPGGVVTEVIDDTGDGTGDINMGTGNFLDRPQGIAIDSGDNVYVAGQFSDNVFRIAASSTCSTTGTPCTITEIIDATSDGTHVLDSALTLAIDGADNVYVGGNSHNVFRIDAPTTCSTGGTPCTIAEVIDATGDGTNPLTQATSVAMDGAGNLFVVGLASDNVFRVAAAATCNTDSPCSITEIIDGTGDGMGNVLDFPRSVAINAAGDAYVVASFSDDNLFRITAPTTCSTGGTPCVITELLAGLGDPQGVAVDNAGNVYFSQGANGVDLVTRVEAPTACSTSGTACMTSTILDASGDGMGATLDLPNQIAVQDTTVYVTASTSSNAFAIANAAVPVELMEFEVD